MRLRELVNCHGCLRATRDWNELVLTSDGRRVCAYRLCKACVSSMTDRVRSDVRESRAAAVSRW